MNRSRNFVVALVLLGLLLFVSASCILSPEQDVETQETAHQDDQTDIPVEEAIICESSEELFTKVMHYDTSLVLVATPISDEDAPQIYYSYELLTKEKVVVGAGCLRTVNPRMEGEPPPDEEFLGWGWPRPQLRIWDWFYYTGASKTMRSSTSNFSGYWRNRANSAIARFSVWSLHDRSNYRGIFIVITGAHRHLSYMTNRANSARRLRLCFSASNGLRPYKPVSR